MAEGAQPRHLVFISHSGADTWVAKQIAKAVKAAGANYFLDREHIDVGANFEEQIRESIAQADELVVYITPWSLERGWVMMEIGAAWHKGIPIICLLHGVQPHGLPEDIPPTARRTLININEIDVYLKQLRARVRRRRATSEES